MKTVIEIARDGTRTWFHRTDGGQSRWTHNEEEKARCKVCGEPTAERLPDVPDAGGGDEAGTP